MLSAVRSRKIATNPFHSLQLPINQCKFSSSAHENGFSNERNQIFTVSCTKQIFHNRNKSLTQTYNNNQRNFPLRATSLGATTARFVIWQTIRTKYSNCPRNMFGHKAEREILVLAKLSPRFTFNYRLIGEGSELIKPCPDLLCTPSLIPYILPFARRLQKIGRFKLPCG